MTIDHVTGEITQGKKQTRAVVVYTNIHGDSTCGGAIASGLDPWGDDLVCVPGGGLLSTQSFSVFNGSSSGDLDSCDLTVRFYDYELTLVGSWSMHLDMIDLIGEPLPPGFAVLITTRGCRART